MAKELDIIIQNSENPHCTPEAINGNAKHLRIILLRNDGSTKEIFKGSEFSEYKWRKRMEEAGRKSGVPLPKGGDCPNCAPKGITGTVIKSGRRRECGECGWKTFV
jgi:ribosomal protein S27AE